MTSRLLYDNLPVYVQWFDTLNGAILAHLCEAIQPEFDLIQQILREYEFFLNLNSPLNDNYLDFLQQFVGSAPIEDRYLGIGLNPGWPIPYKKRVLSQLFQYWQRKGTEVAIRQAIEMWLQWEEARDSTKLEIRYPFGLELTAQPTNWWGWGTPYGEHLSQLYPDRQHWGGGYKPGFNHQPSNFRLQADQPYWLWSSTTWSKSLLTPALFPRLENCENKLGPGEIWTHFYPDLRNYNTWNQLFNNIDALNFEIYPAQIKPCQFQWITDNVLPIPLHESPPERELIIDYDIVGYPWESELWPYPGVALTYKSRIDLVHHVYLSLGWQWNDHLLGGHSVSTLVAEVTKEIEIRIVGSWGSHYGDLSALNPEPSIPSPVAFDSGGTCFGFYRVLSQMIEVWRDVLPGFSESFQAWGGLFYEKVDLTPRISLPIYQDIVGSSDQEQGWNLDLWFARFYKKILINNLDLEFEVESKWRQVENSLLSVSWYSLLQPTAFLLFPEEYFTEVKQILGSDLTICADYLGWEKSWYYPPQDITVEYSLDFPGQVFFHPDITCVFNSGTWWLNTTTRSQIRQSIVDQTLEQEQCYPASVYYYPPGVEIVGHEEIPDPDYLDVSDVQMPDVSDWNSGKSWFYINESGRVLEEIRQQEVVEASLSQYWQYNEVDKIISVTTNEVTITEHTTIATNWYASREWTEEEEVILQRPGDPQCFISKEAQVKVGFNLIEEERAALLSNHVYTSIFMTFPDVVIPGYKGFFPGSQWENTWLSLLKHNIKLFGINSTFQIQPDLQIDIGDLTGESFVIDLNTEFNNLVHRKQEFEMTEIDIQFESWTVSPVPDVIIPGYVLDLIQVEVNRCSSYNEQWNYLYPFVYNRNSQDEKIYREEDLFEIIRLCNIPEFFSEGQIINWTEYWVDVNPNPTLFDRFPEFQSWFDAQTWTLLLETQGELFYLSPTTILWQSESGTRRSYYREDSDILVLEFLSSVLKQEATIRSSTLLKQGEFMSTQNFEYHNKLNSTDNNSVGIRYYIRPVFIVQSLELYHET